MMAKLGNSKFTNVFLDLPTITPLMPPILLPNPTPLIFPVSSSWPIHPNRSSIHLPSSSFSKIFHGFHWYCHQPNPKIFPVYSYYCYRFFCCLVTILSSTVEAASTMLKPTAEQQKVRCNLEEGKLVHMKGTQVASWHPWICLKEEVCI